MKTKLGYLCWIIKYLKRGKCLFMNCKIWLAPELDRGYEPAFPDTHKHLYREWGLTFLKSNKFWEKIMKDYERAEFHLLMRVQDTWAGKGSLCWEYRDVHGNLSGLTLGSSGAREEAQHPLYTLSPQEWQSIFCKSEDYAHMTFTNSTVDCGGLWCLKGPRFQAHSLSVTYSVSPQSLWDCQRCSQQPHSHRT